VYILVYVDDMLVACIRTATSSDVKGKLLTAFDGRDLGPVKSFLGIHITRVRANRLITLDQTSSILDLASAYGLRNAKPKSTPMDPGMKLTRSEGVSLQPGEVPFASLIGSMMYIVMCTRPDAAFSLSGLARFMSQPTSVTWGAAKGVLRYLVSTADLKLCFSGSSSSTKLSFYTDADYAACPDTRKSVSGYVCILNGGAVSWSSKKQSTVTLSTTESEYVAAASAVKEVLWFRTLATDLDLNIPKFVIFGDNQAMLQLAKNPILSARSKHIDIVYHFVRERVASGDVSFTYIPTDKMLADIFTKCLPKIKHEKMRSALGLRS
jgi:hypothetical protein